MFQNCIVNSALIQILSAIIISYHRVISLIPKSEVIEYNLNPAFVVTHFSVLFL